MWQPAGRDVEQGVEQLVHPRDRRIDAIDEAAPTAEAMWPRNFAGWRRSWLVAARKRDLCWFASASCRLFSCIFGE
jgi:hypothetical protein